MDAPPDWSAVDAAFDRALDRDGPAREAYLEALAPPLRERVRRLLAASVRADTLLDAPRAVLETLAADLPASPGCERLGTYRLGDVVGEGGMGRVYRAADPSGRAVAVKVVRHTFGLASADVLARLRRERALLAALDHPGIARLLDGGETEAGDPYLVMEFVEGEPITEWADARGLTVRARVGLMAEVARAVAHAHERRVLHRDLKPSNVLVTDRGEGPRPVVLDLGIGKLLADDPSEALPRLTRTGQRLMTPAYGAPELSDPDAPVTAAVDVFGLGVLLYELLVSARPFRDAGQHAPAPPAPPPPLVVVGAQRTGRTAALYGAVNAACLQALAIDPARRFASAGALADALDAALAAEPERPRRRPSILGRFGRR